MKGILLILLLSFLFYFTETIAAPSFAIFLVHITSIFYFPKGPSTVYFVWTALIQLGIQFVFDFVAVVVLRAQVIIYYL